MKTYGKLLFVLVVIQSLNAVAAGTNLTFDVLHTAQGDFINATIIRTTPAYAVVDWPGGLAKVWLTNFPPEMQKQLGYNPTNAAAAIAAEKQKRLNDLKTRADQQRRLAALRGSNQVVRVTAVYDAPGECQISGFGGGRVYMQGLPDSIGNFFVRRAQLKTAIANLQAQRITVTATDNSGDSVNSYMMAQDALYEAKQAKAEKLQQMKDELAELNHAEMDYTTLIAYPTGTSYSGLPIWQCVDVAPPTLR